MAHFAQLDNNGVVLNVIVVDNSVINNLQFPESEAIGIEYLKSIYGEDTIWKQTSYNHQFRKRYASIGFTYIPSLDAFVSPRPFPSWTFDEETASYIPPVPYPYHNAHKYYFWNEENQQWVLIDQA